MERHYFDALTELGDDPAVRAIVVTGAGRAFCAGADMDDLDSHANKVPTGHIGDRPQTYALTVGKPVIAAINGACAGIGLVQAIMCDVRFVAEEAKLTTSFSKIGLIAEHGSSWMLAKHVGIGNALDMLLSARIVLPDEALRMGLVSRICHRTEIVDEAIAYADQIAATVSPLAMAVIKNQVYTHYNLALSAALAKSNDLMVQALNGSDFHEGVAAFREHRLPRYPGFNSGLIVPDPKSNEISTLTNGDK